MKHTSTIWTCDRCHVTDETAPNDQPKTWTAVRIVDPPLMSPMEHNGLPIHLCRNCTVALNDWIAEPDASAALAS